MSIRWNQVAIAAATGFLLGAFFSDLYRMHRKPGPPPQRMGSPMEIFNRELDLTGLQREKVSTILEKYQPQMEKVMNENRPKMEELRSQIKAEMETVLTPSQIARFEEIKKEFEARGPGALPGGPFRPARQ
ncbi:MAG: Spy/CpxP family protein refolding chaperone [Elusimicrobiales bacterium]